MPSTMVGDSYGLSNQER